MFPQLFFTTQATVPKKSLVRHIPAAYSSSVSFFLIKSLLFASQDSCVHIWLVELASAQQLLISTHGTGTPRICPSVIPRLLPVLTKRKPPQKEALQCLPQHKFREQGKNSCSVRPQSSVGSLSLERLLRGQYSRCPRRTSLHSRLTGSGATFWLAADTMALLVLLFRPWPFLKPALEGLCS